MLTVVFDNLGTIVVSLILVGVIAAIMVRLVRNKQKGKCIGCDCGCQDCHEGEAANSR